MIVYPTDSVYAFGCSLHSTRAIERIRTLTGKQGDDFSIICHDLSGIAAYARCRPPHVQADEAEIFRVPLPSCSVRRTKSPTNSSTAKNGRRPDPCGRHPAGHRRGIGQSVG
ncbi:MAG: Sua5/YciO/YrdC/YwlC family protein [Alistipes indistinctus]